MAEHSAKRLIAANQREKNSVWGAGYLLPESVESVPPLCACFKRLLTTEATGTTESKQNSQLGLQRLHTDIVH
ncbi:MAG: hypothetical protein U0350_48860 [Caldilineaceae bacterium]